MEEWRDIKGYEGLYKISNIGRVKSYQTFGNNQKIGREHFITPTLTTNGYYRVELIKDNQRKTHRIHRLVAFAFLPNPENKPYINHIDGNRLNNHITNLEWCTQKENNEHAIRTGLRKLKKLSKDDMVQMYVIEHKAISKIAKENHISDYRVRKYLDEYEIPVHIGTKYEIPIDELKKDIENGLTNSELMEKYNCSRDIIATRRTQIRKGVI